MKRLILDARVTMVSLCRRGKNNLRTLYKGQDGASFQALVKASDTFDERGQLLAVVTAPGFADFDGDVFESAEAIAKAAHSFMRAGADLDLTHNLKPLSRDDAFVAESFVIQKADERFKDWTDYEGRKVDVTGGWGMVIQIDHPELRKSYRNGEWDGVSLYAPEARLKVLEKSNDLALSDELRKVFVDAGIINPTNTNEEFDMDAKELAETLKTSNVELAKAIVEGVVAAIKPAAPKEKPADTEVKAPLFKGDPSNPKDIKAHMAALERHALETSGDLENPEKLAELLAKAEKPEDGKAEDSDELKKARARVAELEKGSNRKADPEPKKTPAHSFVTAGLVKAEDAGLMSAASAAAKAMNDARYGSKS